jgi:CrcB protein
MNQALNLVIVFVGGGAGSVLRYLIGQWIPKGSLPWHTLTANVLASTILGFFTALMLLRPGQLEQQRLLLAVGFCGGLSTFSTFSLETVELIRSGNHSLAVVYMVVSVLSCLLTFWGAWTLVR